MNALKQWYETMIPSLFPIMLCSNIMVNLGIARKIGRFIRPTLLAPLRISENGAYCVLTGFLFGFPMGAKTVSDLYQNNQLSLEEAQYLLTFINCIGPMYTYQVVYPTFQNSDLLKLFLGLYGIPFLYGILLRYTVYKSHSFTCMESTNYPVKKQADDYPLMDALYHSVINCSHSILYLAGFMILFQLSFLPLEHMLEYFNLRSNYLYPLLEITGGLYLLPKDTPLFFILPYVMFGGGCCILQTYSFLKPAGLSIKNYILHKGILSLLVFFYGILISL